MSASLVGSEMCIRDRACAGSASAGRSAGVKLERRRKPQGVQGDDVVDAPGVLELVDAPRPR
eukprot:11672600-Alexandrium_andersonii.AAC.1